jgi:broad specificity phosphatase PhoE
VKVTIYLVRHAKAGDRASWDGDDFLRPLSRRGQIQAEALLTQFDGLHIDRLLSSPYIRCMESLVPLAGVRRIPIEPLDAITEGASLEDALTLVRKHSHHDAVLCSHGDIIPMLLEHYAAQGVDLGKDPVCPKGCTWILEIDGAHDVVAARYLPPPTE